MRVKNNNTKAYIALVIVSFFWGTTYIAARIGVQHMPGLFMAGIRQFVSGALLVGFFLLRGHPVPGWRVLKTISIQGIFLLCIANGLLTWSVEYISGGLAAIIAALVPLFIALFTSWLSRKARITAWMLTGLVIGFGGVVIIFYDYVGQLGKPSFVLGVTLALLSTLSWSFGTVYTAGKKSSLDILYNVGWQMLIAGVVILLVCAVTGRYTSLASIDSRSLLALLYLIVFGSLVAYSAYVFMISQLPPTQASVYAYINPLVAVVLGWFLLSEKLNGNVLLGTAVTLAGVYLVNREARKLKQQ